MNTKYKAIINKIVLLCQQNRNLILNYGIG